MLNWAQRRACYVVAACDVAAGLVGVPLSATVVLQVLEECWTKQTAALIASVADKLCAVYRVCREFVLYPWFVESKEAGGLDTMPRKNKK